MGTSGLRLVAICGHAFDLFHQGEWTLEEDEFAGLGCDADVSAGVLRGDSFVEDFGDGVEELRGLLVCGEGAAACIQIFIQSDLRVAVDFEEDRPGCVGGPQIGVDMVSGGPDAEGFVLDWAAGLSVDDANVDFGGLRVGDAGHDEECAEESELGEVAAFGVDAGYEGVEHNVGLSMSFAAVSKTIGTE